MTMSSGCREVSLVLNVESMKLAYFTLKRSPGGDEAMVLSFIAFAFTQFTAICL